MRIKTFAATFLAALLFFAVPLGTALIVKAQEGVQPLPTVEVSGDLDLSGSPLVPPPAPIIMPEATLSPQPVPEPDRPDVIWPYAGIPQQGFVVTQGDHGASYGQAAIDIAAGSGQPILAVSDGKITSGGLDEDGNQKLDQWGNPYIELTDSDGNITHLFLHGDYIVREGQELKQGEIIGYESNHGYTLCWDERPPNGRNCGYHTHWAAFDASTGEMVYPGDLILGTVTATQFTITQSSFESQLAPESDINLSQVLSIFGVVIVVMIVVGMLWHSRPIRWFIGKMVWLFWFIIAFGYLVLPDFRQGPLDDLMVMAVTYVLNKLSQRAVNRLMSWRKRDDSPLAQELRQVESEMKFLRFGMAVMVLAVGLATYLPLEWLNFSSRAEAQNTSGQVPVYADVVLVNDGVITWLQELRFYDNRVFANIVERSRWMRGADGRRTDVDGTVLPWQLPVATYFGETPSSDGSGAYVAYWMAPSEEPPVHVPQDKILVVDPRTPGPWGWQNCINAFESTYPGSQYDDRRALMHAGLEKIAADPEVQTLWPGTTPDQLHCSRAGAIGRGQTMLFHFADGKLAGDLGNFNVWTNPATVAEVTIRHHSACWFSTPDIQACVIDYLGSYNGPYVNTVVSNASRLESGYTERFGLETVAVKTETEEIPETQVAPDESDGIVTSPITVTVDAGENEFPTLSVTTKTLPKVRVGEINVYSTLIVELIADMRADTTPSQFDAWLLPKLEMYAGFAYLITPKEWVASNPTLADITGGTPSVSMREATVALYLHDLHIDRESNEFMADNIRWFLVNVGGNSEDFRRGEGVNFEKLRAGNIRGKFTLQALEEWSLLEHFGSFEATRAVGGMQGKGASELATTLRILASQIDGIDIVCGHCGEEYAYATGKTMPPEMAVLVDPVSGADLILRSDRERVVEFLIEGSKITFWVSRQLN